MSNQVTFQIKIETTGGDGVKQVTMDAEELGRVVKEVGNEQEKLNTKLLDINQAQQAIQNVVSGIKQIADEISNYTSAYAAQETAETKLAQVMRNTMGATQAEVESIKELCAAQQELGVIGDEVQLAGAQELATYLEKKSSLEQLIPVMNDMVAQQYGLDASQENAAQIATMLGKVMEGQVNALSRYGYSFTEAQEKVLKFGTEEERAAMLAEVVSQSVGGMNQALRDTPSGQLKAVENTMGDLKEQVGACLVRLQPLVSVAAQAGLALQGIANTANGVRGLAVAIGSLNVVQRAWNVVSVTSTAIIRTLTAAMHGGTVGATTLRIAIRGLLISTGVGAAIAALTMIIDAFASSADNGAEEADELADSTHRLADAQSQEAAMLQQTRSALELNIAKLKDFHGSKKEEKKLIEEMNNTYGETMGYFSSVAEWYQALINNSEAYCRQMVIEARLRQLANQIVDDDQQVREINRKLNAGEYSDERKKKSEYKYDDFGNPIGVVQEDIEGSSQMEKAMGKVLDLQVATLNAKEEMRDLVEELGGINLKFLGSSSHAGTTPPKKEKPKEGSEAWMKQEIQRLQKEADNEPDIEKRVKLLVDKSALESELKHMQIEDSEAVLRKQGRKTRMESLQVSIMPNIERDIKEAENRLKSLKLKPVKIEVDTKQLKKAEDDMKAASEGLQSMGQGLSSLGSALELPELNVAGIIAQAIATMVQGYAQATSQAADLGPWAWVAFTGTGFVQLASIISSVKNLAKFADGGVAYGPTLGIFGEYSNAATNPEVVAPLDRLRALIGTDGGGPIEIKLRVKGRDLVGVAEKRQALTRRA